MKVAGSRMRDLVGRAARFSAYSGTVRRGAVPLKSAANDNQQGSKWHREAIPSSPSAWAKSVGTTVAETLGFGTFGETEEEKSKRLEKERIAKAVEEFERNHDEYKKLADIEAAEQESAKILMDHAAVADYEPDTPEDEKTRQLLAEYLAENPSLIDKFIDLPEDVWITNKAANYLAGKISAISKSIKRTAAQCGKEVAEFIKDECPTCVKVLSQTVDTASELADHSFPVVAQQIARMEFAQEINDISSVVGNYIDRKTTPDQREAASAIVSLLSIFVPLGIMGKAKFAAKLDKIGDIIDQAPGAPLVFKKGKVPNTVENIGGRSPINAEFAGKKYPMEKLPEHIQKKYPNSVYFDEKGFPDFKPYATAEVDIELTGNRKLDERKANKIAGLDRTPDGYTWHHDAITEKMQLVPSDLHDQVRHTGSFAKHKHNNKKDG